MKALIQKLLGATDGKKTMLGLLLFVVGRYVILYDPAAGESISDIGLTLAGVGAAHKLWKNE